MKMIMYFAKKKYIRCDCYCSHEMCIFVLCIVQLSAKVNQKKTFTVTIF